MDTHVVKTVSVKPVNIIYILYYLYIIFYPLVVKCIINVTWDDTVLLCPVYIIYLYLPILPNEM